jgi:hypothetical protein
MNNLIKKFSLERLSCCIIYVIDMKQKVKQKNILLPLEIEAFRDIGYSDQYLAGLAKLLKAETCRIKHYFNKNKNYGESIIENFDSENKGQNIY